MSVLLFVLNLLTGAGLLAIIFLRRRQVDSLSRAVADSKARTDKLEFALQESDERYHLIVENAPDAIVVLDPNTGLFIEVNAAAVELFGYAREVLLTMSPFTLSPPNQADGRTSEEAAATYIADAVRGNNVVFEWLHTNAQNQILNCEVRLVRLRRDGQYYIRGSVIDIGERKKTREELARREALIQSLIDHTPALIFVKDLHGRYLLSNRKLRNLVLDENQPEASIAKVYTYDGEFGEIYRKHDLRVIEGKQPIQVEEPSRLDGILRIYDVMKFPLMDSSNAVYAICGIATDITERREAELAEKEGLLRVSRQQALIAKFATHPATEIGDIETVAHFVTEQGADVIDVERVSVWLFTKGEPFTLRCVDVFKRSTGRHSVDPPIDRSSHSVYLAEIMSARCVATTDSVNDPRTSELTDDYLRPHGITAMLESPIRAGGQAVGVLCFEHTEGTRVWHADEILCASEIAGQLGFALLNREKRANEAEMRRIEELYRRAIQAAGAVPYFQVYAAGKYDYIGENVELLTGYSVTEFTSKILDRITIDYETRGVAKNIALDDAVDLARSGRIDVWQCDYKILTKNGEVRWISDAAVENLDAHGHSTGSVGLFLDITERKRTEESLVYQVELLKFIAEISTRFVNVAPEIVDQEVVYALARLGDFAKVDRAMFHLFAESTSRIAKSFDWSARSDSAETVNSTGSSLVEGPIIQSCVESGSPILAINIDELAAAFDVDVRQLNAEGVRSLASVPITFSGRVVCVIVVQTVHEKREWPQDMPALLRIAGEIFYNALSRKRAEEERHHLEEQVRHAQKLESLGVLAGGIAHDFNNLLVAILGNADLALQELPHSSQARDYLRDIESASHRAADLCRQMLAYSGKGHFVVEMLSVRDLIMEMAKILEVSISKKANLSYNFDESIPAIRADATQIRQIIMNLITNASEAMGDKGGIIALCAGSVNCDKAYLEQLRIAEDLKEGRYVYVEVSDTGGGMDKDTIERVFEPFFTTKFTGRGLGMAAVLGIVRGHHGAIKIYSEVGKGTTIRVLFPAAEGQSVEKPIALGDNLIEWRPTGTILLIDDEISVRSTCSRLLEKLGFDVLVASDGREAMGLYKAHEREIVCIIVDLTMPVMDGEETVRALYELNCTAPILLSSGYSEQELSKRFDGVGLAGFVEKPYSLDTLRRKVRIAMTQR